MFGARNDAIAIRKKQVATLSQYFPVSTVRELQPDVLYEIPVAAPGRILVRVSVHLPEQFPYQPPVLQCSPSVPTPHMDMNGYIKPTANEGLARWSVQNNLGKLVYEVIAGVIAPATPAAPVGGPPPSNGGGAGLAPSVYPPLTSPAPASGGFVSSPASQPHLSNPHQSGAIPAPSSSQPRRQASDPARADMPAIPASFDELEGKPLEMLRNFATSEDHLMLFLEDVQYYQGLRKLRDAARDATAAQAQKNLDRRADMEHMRQRLVAAVSELEEAKRQYDAQLALQKSVSRAQTPQNLVTMLQSEARAMDSASEKDAQRFLEGGVPLKEFLAGYMEKRRLFHLRASKLEAIQRTM